MTITSLAGEPITFLLTIYGAGLALGFRGDVRTIERCYNWAHNTGVTKGVLHHLYGPDGLMAYVYTSQAALLAGLIAQFRAEVMLNEVPPVVNEWNEETGELRLEWDEPRVLQLATNRAQDFLRDRFVSEQFLHDEDEIMGPTYGWHGPRVADTGD